MKLKKKSIFHFLVIICSVLFITIVSLVPINTTKSGSKWMSQVDDNYNIVDLSIPGTHDSGATHSIFDVAGKCQELSIKSQLNIGVRFLDIRLQLVNDDLNVVHSFVDQNLKFSKVLKDVTNFINKNPSEFLLISLKEDASSKSSTDTFENVLTSLLKQYENVICFDSSLPKTLKEARGKIYILSRCNLPYGINAYYNCGDSSTFTLNDMYIQDNYCIDDVNVKINDIKSTIQYSNSTNDKLVINFTSCYLDYGFPPTYSIPPAKTINKWFNSYIVENDEEELGIMVMDFITAKIAKNIYMRNIV